MWLRGGWWQLHQTQNRLGQCAHQGVDDASLQGLHLPSEDDVDTSHGHQGKQQDPEEGKDVLPGGGPLLNRHVLADRVECRSSDVFGPKNFKPLRRYRVFLRREGDLIQVLLVVLDDGVKPQRDI